MVFPNPVELNNYHYMIYKHKVWLKIFYHNYTGKTFFDPLTNEAVHTGDLNSKKYSILSEVNDTMKSYNDKYEFIIHWPDFDTYYQWRQSKNPLYELEREGIYAAEGFEPIYNGSNLANSDWGGLVKSAYVEDTKEQCLLNGNPGVLKWFFSIGQYNNCSSHWGNLGIPAINNATSQVDLWLRLPNIYGLFFQQSLINIQISYSSLFVILNALQ